MERYYQGNQDVIALVGLSLLAHVESAPGAVFSTPPLVPMHVAHDQI